MDTESTSVVDLYWEPLLTIFENNSLGKLNIWCVLKGKGMRQMDENNWESMEKTSVDYIC